MRWTLLAIAAFIAIIILTVLGYFSIITIDVGITLAVVSAITPFIFYFIDNYLKPKIDIRIENPQLIEKKVSQDISGHQLKDTELK